MPTEPGRPYPSLAADLEADVAIVGAGIVGLTAAHLLKAAGRTVAVLEARPCDLKILEHAMNVTQNGTPGPAPVSCGLSARQPPRPK